MTESAKYFRMEFPATETILDLQPDMAIDAEGRTYQRGTKTKSMDIINGLVAIDANDQDSLDVIKRLTNDQGWNNQFIEIDAAEYRSLMSSVNGLPFNGGSDQTAKELADAKTSIEQKDAEIAALLKQLEEAKKAQTGAQAGAKPAAAESEAKASAEEKAQADIAANGPTSSRG